MKLLLLWIALMSFILIGAQEVVKSSKLIPHSIGVFYGRGVQKNIFFNDLDYAYETNLIKLSLYYPLNQRNYQLGLSIQPQVHFLEHQLRNLYFVQPQEANFEELRERFTQIKQMRLYALQGELSLKKEVLNKLDVSLFLGFGPAIIDTETERLSKGFTFIENLGLGIHYAISDQWKLVVRPSYNHLSNAELQDRNSGYNAMVLEFGITFSP